MFDPFEILNLEKSYSLDPLILEKHYFAEQKKSHPDQFSRATPEEKAQALKQSILVNQAYQILKNPLQRAEYLLKSAGVDSLSHDPSFLGEVMTWTERLQNGKDLKPELLDKEEFLFNELENGLRDKDYEKARVAFYRLTYVCKLLRQSEGE